MNVSCARFEPYPLNSSEVDLFPELIGRTAKLSEPGSLPPHAGLAELEGLDGTIADWLTELVNREGAAASEGQNASQG